MDYIAENYRAFGGEMSKEEIRAMLHIGSQRCTKLLARVREGMGK